MIFDGHNDALLRLWRRGGDVAARWESDEGDLNGPAARAGGMAGGFFAIFSPGAEGLDFRIFDNPPYDTPLPPELKSAAAMNTAMGQAGVAHRLAEAGHLRLIREAADLDVEGPGLACLLHLEGAECIGPDLLALDALHALGLRSVGPVWSRPTVFAHGVPFRFPSDGDTGPGLTEDGRRLARALKSKRMVLDTSHMTMKGFYDVAEEGLPLVATHSNVHAISPSARNLTDDQLRAIGETEGMVGLNFGTVFLREDGGRGGDVPLDMLVRHLAQMVEVAGEDRVGLGSDFDGAPMPDDLQSAADLPNLVAAMEEAGFGAELIAKITHANWHAFLRRTL